MQKLRAELDELVIEEKRLVQISGEVENEKRRIEDMRKKQHLQMSEIDSEYLRRQDNISSLTAEKQNVEIKISNMLSVTADLELKIRTQ